MTQENLKPSKRKLVIGGAAATGVAAIVLVLFVLPSEFGIDPTGAGKALGLTGLSETGEMTELERGALRKGKVLAHSDATILTDRWEIELEPLKSLEFKYTMEEDAGMLFKWEATSELHYDMHSHPFEGGTALTESYGIGDARQMEGTYIAPFTGIHGWHWQNQTMDNVTLVLETTGGFTESTIFDEIGEHSRPIPAAE